MDKRHIKLHIADEDGGPLEQLFSLLPYFATFIITPILAPTILLILLFYVGKIIICTLIMMVLFELANYSGKSGVQNFVSYSL